jgi:lipopolysaccharide export system protein LptA
MYGLILNTRNVGNVPGYLKHAGTARVFFVDSNGGGSTTSGGLTPEAAFTTIDSAIGACTANKGDVIYVLPGHAETISAAAGIAADVAGISIIGLGNGTDRPTLTLSATDSTIAVSAANITFKNLIIKSSVNELVKIFNITAAYCTIDAVDVKDNGSAKEILQFALTDSGADFLTIQNCYHVQLTAGASTQRWIYLVGTESARILDNTFILKLNDAATACAISADGDSRLTEIGGNRMHITGYTSGLVSAVIGASGATGIHYDGRYYVDTTITTTINDTQSMPSFEVYCSNDLDKNGILDPVVGS